MRNVMRHEPWNVSSVSVSPEECPTEAVPPVAFGLTSPDARLSGSTYFAIYIGPWNQMKGFPPVTATVAPEI